MNFKGRQVLKLVGFIFACLFLFFSIPIALTMFTMWINFSNHLLSSQFLLPVFVVAVILNTFIAIPILLSCAFLVKNFYPKIKTQQIKIVLIVLYLYFVGVSFKDATFYINDLKSLDSYSNQSKKTFYYFAGGSDDQNSPRIEITFITKDTIDDVFKYYYAGDFPNKQNNSNLNRRLRIIEDPNLKSIFYGDFFGDISVQMQQIDESTTKVTLTKVIK